MMTKIANVIQVSLCLAAVMLSSLNHASVSAFGSTKIARRGSFLASNQSIIAGRRTTSARSMASLSMVIDRLSNECVAAVKESHDICNDIGLNQLRVEVLFAGVCRKPERAAQTLQKFGIKYDAVRASAIQTIFAKSGVNLMGPNPTRDAVPFSDNTKIVLTKACQIADGMESKLVRSEHLLLALLGYSNGNKITDVPVLKVLEGMKSLTQGDDKFSVGKFCTELVNALPMTPVEGDDVIFRDTVVIGGQGGSTNTLREVGVDMTQLALENKLDVIFGRDKEIRTALRTLGRRRKNNPCLIGDPGVGKTAVAEAIAQVLANGLLEIEEEIEKAKPVSKIKKSVGNLLGRKQKEDTAANGQETELVDYDLPPCPKSLLGARLISVELASLVAGTANRGDFEQRVKDLIKEASESNVILFIDEIHNLIGTGGGGDGAMNAANLFKPALARGDLKVLGATTTAEYRKYIEKDGALERRFQPLEVKEPTVFETLDILAAVSPKYQEYHGVEYTYNALLSATKLSDRYISDRFLPDKAIDLIDEAGSMVNQQEEGESFYVTEDAIQAVIAEMTGIPLGKLDTDEKSRLKNLEQEIEQRIKGQTPAVHAVAKSIRRARSGMRDGKRPVASLMFCGPTGVGKTELCKALAETYFGAEKDMIRVDMSEYMDRFSTSRLIGAPPGYVGYDEGGQLTEAVRRAPHSVILFDELEKAHEDVLNLLLQIMDEGTLTDGKGRTINFKNNIFVMTSNVGSKEILQVAKGADDNADDFQLTADVVKAALEEAMRPELLNRIDEIVVFAPLSYDNLKAIATNMIAETVKRAQDDQNMKITVSDNIAEIVTREALGVASLYGARPIRRAVQRYLEDTLAEAIMGEFIDEGDEVQVNLKDPNSGMKVVEIKRMLDGKSTLIDVDGDAGISQEGFDFQAAFGDLPKLDDPPKKEPDTFQ